jgi:hypothetical protein
LSPRDEHMSDDDAERLRRYEARMEKFVQQYTKSIEGALDSLAGSFPEHGHRFAEVMYEMLQRRMSHGGPDRPETQRKDSPHAPERMPAP